MAKEKIAFMEGISLEDHSVEEIKEVELSDVRNNSIYKEAVSNLTSPKITGLFHKHTIVVECKEGEKLRILGLYSPELAKLIKEIV